MALSSPTAYHTTNLVHEFIGVRTADLQHDIAMFMDLREHLLESEEREPTRSNSVIYVDRFLDRAVSELEHRSLRSKRGTSRRMSRSGDLWVREDRYNDMKDLAQEIKSRLSVAEYLERYVPWAVMKLTGTRLRGRCPLPGHADRTASFVVFPDDHAWCFGCRRGGDLFRLVGLIEGIPHFRDQLQFVTNLIEPSGRKAF